ncbi:hypothetical protein CPB84DRAFT_1748696 [Gymnopilus junonius]|uniref:Uncharacterized protein n=1 Tax=Gymnopilus junonius TaxID=109634 RepID=A0A9P5NM80_GYMJU|nr:hypothetical protein CPB84DRAFT_1748696 [Gymnopilus junonius]
MPIAVPPISYPGLNQFTPPFSNPSHPAVAPITESWEEVEGRRWKHGQRWEWVQRKWKVAMRWATSGRGPTTSLKRTNNITAFHLLHTPPYSTLGRNATSYFLLVIKSTSNDDYKTNIAANM